MSNITTTPDNNNNLLTLQELFSESIEVAVKAEQLNFILNASPPEKWIKTHPYIPNYRYLPIDKVEYLLRKIFKKYKIEILREGTAFNGVYVVVRVHYLDPVTNTMEWHDGIGAIQLQTAKGTSPADLANINNGAISMAFPIAKTVAVKDACDHFGNLFGCNINRKDTLPFTIDEKLLSMMPKSMTASDLQVLLDEKIADLNKTEFDFATRVISTNETQSFKKLQKLLTEKHGDDNK